MFLFSWHLHPDPGPSKRSDSCWTRGLFKAKGYSSMWIQTSFAGRKLFCLQIRFGATDIIGLKTRLFVVAASIFSDYHSITPAPFFFSEYTSGIWLDHFQPCPTCHMAPYRLPPLIISTSISNRGAVVLVGNLTICIEKLLSFLRLFCIITSDLRPDQTGASMVAGLEERRRISCVSLIFKDNHMLQSRVG